ILGEQRDLPRVLASLVERLDRPAPGRPLAVVALAQIQHMPLHRSPARYPAVLHDAPVAVLLAVLPAKLVAQKHAARLPKPQAVSQGTWSAPHAVSAGFPPPLLRFSRAYRWPQTAKFPKPRLSCESRVKRRRSPCAGHVSSQEQTA